MYLLMSIINFFILQLAQLMADLQKMPGGAGLLKKQAAKQKTKERGSVSEEMSSVINFSETVKSKWMYVLKFFDQLCVASAAVWRRAQEDSRAGVSQTDTLYGRR